MQYEEYLNRVSRRAGVPWARAEVATQTVLSVGRGPALLAEVRGRRGWPRTVAQEV